MGTACFCIIIIIEFVCNYIPVVYMESASQGTGCILYIVGKSDRECPWIPAKHCTILTTAVIWDMFLLCS